MIYLGCDHGGYDLKEKVKTWLKEWKFDFEDLGPQEKVEDDDYPLYAFKVAETVSSVDDPSKPWADRPKGLLICRSAAGVIIAANKVFGIRAVAAFDELSAKHSREHNDANVLGLSGDWLDDKKAQAIIKTWLATEFSKESRHKRRIDRISAYEMDVYGGGGGCCGGGGCGDGGCGGHCSCGEGK